MRKYLGVKFYVVLIWIVRCLCREGRKLIMNGRNERMRIKMIVGNKY